ncbi:MAG: hypothetical protein NTZ67_00250 [Gammaproteobacteria bacterium]|nr:hypothetical protein [Gammaproteobacteria bacterium]
MRGTPEDSSESFTTIIDKDKLNVFLKKLFPKLADEVISPMIADVIFPMTKSGLKTIAEKIFNNNQPSENKDSARKTFNADFDSKLKEATPQAQSGEMANVLPKYDDPRDHFRKAYAETEKVNPKSAMKKQTTYGTEKTVKIAETTAAYEIHAFTRLKEAVCEIVKADFKKQKKSSVAILQNINKAETTDAHGEKIVDEDGIIAAITDEGVSKDARQKCYALITTFKGIYRQQYDTPLLRLAASFDAAPGVGLIEDNPEKGAEKVYAPVSKSANFDMTPLSNPEKFHISQPITHVDKRATQHDENIKRLKTEDQKKELNELNRSVTENHQKVQQILKNKDATPEAKVSAQLNLLGAEIEYQKKAYELEKKNNKLPDVLNGALKEKIAASGAMLTEIEELSASLVKEDGATKKVDYTSTWKPADESVLKKAPELQKLTYKLHSLTEEAHPSEWVNVTKNKNEVDDVTDKTVSTFKP